IKPPNYTIIPAQILSGAQHEIVEPLSIEVREFTEAEEKKMCEADNSLKPEMIKELILVKFSIRLELEMADPKRYSAVVPKIPVANS
ncbi:MAG TPA: hypothetical protein VI546_04290, partial [candidate division Zixibacteria bacterium]|nr:hypothetical protein [candidate division Zixibacteria bacterium]